jgi:hypothetical protein
MLAILHLLAMFVVDLFKPRRQLEVENLFLRHQLNIALRRAPRRLRLRGSDRALLVWMTRLWPSLLGLARVVQPDTILRWHRAGFRAYWRWKSGARAGRPPVSRELRELIHRMSKENPLWGAPRIHGELLKLGFEIAESTVSKYMIRHRGPPSQSWRTFLAPRPWHAASTRRGAEAPRRVRHCGAVRIRTSAGTAGPAVDRRRKQAPGPYRNHSQGP